MPLPRLHLFEFEDQPWFPALLRRGMTDYLAEMIARTNPYAPVVAPLRDLIDRARPSTVVDLCSGGGGPWPQLIAPVLDGHPATSVRLTDAYPNPDAVQRFPAGAPVHYRQTPQAVDACPVEPGTIRTLFSCFHHFRPAHARAILADAAAAATPIAVFEATSRSVKSLLLMTLVPIAVLVLTPLIRPFRWWRILFTYLIPVIPVLVWWDGVVSVLRAYTPDELRALANDSSTSALAWTAGELQPPGAPLPVVYLLGLPRALPPPASHQAGVP